MKMIEKVAISPALKAALAGSAVGAGLGAAIAPKGEKKKGALIGALGGPILGPIYPLYRRIKKRGETEKKDAEKVAAGLLRKALPYAATAAGVGTVAGGAGYVAGAGKERKKGTEKARRAFRVGKAHGRFRGRVEGRVRGRREMASYIRERAQTRAIKKLQGEKKMGKGGMVY